MPKEMIIRDPTKYKGKYVKAGEAFIKLSDILDAKVSTDGQGKKLVIKRKGKGDHVYRGLFVDQVKKAIDDNPEGEE